MWIDTVIAIAPCVWKVLKMGYRPIKREVGYIMSSKIYADNLRQEVQKLDCQLQRVPVLLASFGKPLQEAEELLGGLAANKTCCRGSIPDPRCRSQFSRKAQRKTDDIQKLIGPVTYAADLWKEVENLENEVERVGVLVKEARNNVRNVRDGFTRWEANADKALKEARDLLGQDLLGDFEGTLPRDQFSTKAEAQIKVVRDLTQESIRFRVIDDIASIDHAPGRREGKNIPCIASTSIKLESRDLMIQKIKDALDDNSKSVVGVYGMGGIGKSTLLDQVKSRLSKENSFDWVAKADVSQNPDIKRIQGEIAHWLGLTDINKEEDPLPRAELLQKRLEKEVTDKKKVLIILDDLWEKLDLKSVGIPCGHDNKARGCKLLLTSRERNVLQSEMGCDEAFLLGELQKEEARALFEDMVGDKVHKDEFRSMVNEALERCAGWPFLIVQMAKLFRHANSSGWRDAFYQMKGWTNEGMIAKINTLLRVSYDHLESGDAKSLLQLCAAYAVSEPDFENLLRYGFGLGIFRNCGSMERARDRLSVLIRTLQDSSLLLEIGDGDGFKIHDLVRDFVAQFILRDHPLLLLKDEEDWESELSKDKLKSCRAICFPYIDMKELPRELHCPELQTFLLFTNSESLKLPHSLFHSMRNLMVLNLAGIHFICSPSPLQFLKSLHTLCLQSCSLDDVAILGELKELQILSIVNSDIQRLPKEIGQLVELRLLDLSRCSQLAIIEPGVLGSLTKLEELYMDDSFHQWSAVEQTSPTNASLIELNHMKNLRTLNVFIPKSSMLPEDLNFQQLTKYRIGIGKTWYWWSECKGTRTLYLQLKTLINVPWKGCIQSILGKTDDLHLEELDGSEQSICTLSQKGFPELKSLVVENSPSIRCILQSPSHAVFEKLESLLLENLINLEKICYSHVSTGSFSTLKEVQVYSCNKMEVLFPRSVARELPQLEEIIVVDCKLMRGIVEADDGRGKLELPKLRVLTLHDLPNIENFIIAGSAPLSSTSYSHVGAQIAFFNGQVSFPFLESLTIDNLPNLKEIWSDESPLEMSNLQSLEVMLCESLSKVISFRSLGQLPKLQTLCINGCSSVQEIFYFEGPSASGIVETLSELTTLELDELGSLRRIWNKNPSGIMRFHNLKEFKLNDCDNLEFIFFPSMVKSLAQLRDLTVSNCKEMETIIAEEEGVGVEISETLAFPMLTNLTLTHLESLTSFSRGKCSREARSKDHVNSHSTSCFSREVAFPSLETLHIQQLDNLMFMFFSSTVKSLTQLRKLNIWGCKKMEAIIMEEEGLRVAISESLAFPMLTDLHLVELKSLTCFSREKCSRESGSQDHVQLHSSMFFNREVSFPRLETLEINDLDNLGFMFSSSTVKSLTQLRKLSVSSCEKMEAIIMEEEGLGVEISGTLQFPMLTELSLEYLKSLTCFSHGSREAQGQERVKPRSSTLFNQEVALPSLETLYIRGMDNIEMIWENQAAVDSFSKLKSLSVVECNTLVTAVPSFVLGQLLCLESLEAEACGSLGVVFGLQPLIPLDGPPVALPLKKAEDIRITEAKVCMG